MNLKIAAPRRVVALRIRAHAKINLSLRVVGSRPDGYHELKTVFQSLALHDTLTFTPREGPFEIRCADPGVPAGPANLVHQAAVLLWEVLGRAGDPDGVSVAITKRVPAQGGLGGGSADGAAALVALSALWQVRLAGPALGQLAQRLGADVPYFLTGGTALGLGRGDEIYPLVDRPRAWVVLAVPPFGVPTADAFRWVDEAAAPRGGKPASAKAGLNDLEEPVVRRHPELGDLIRQLGRRGAEAAGMSGSGSTVFGLFPAKAAAEAARDAIARPGWHMLVTRTLGRKDYLAGLRPARVVRRRNVIGTRPLSGSANVV